MRGTNRLGTVSDGGHWVPAFAGMTVFCGDGGLSWGCRTFAGMTVFRGGDGLSWGGTVVSGDDGGCRGATGGKGIRWWFDLFTTNGFWGRVPWFWFEGSLDSGRGLQSLA